MPFSGWLLWPCLFDFRVPWWMVSWEIEWVCGLSGWRIVVGEMRECSSGLLGSTLCLEFFWILFLDSIFGIAY